MLEIVKLNQLETTDMAEMGFNGFETSEILSVKRQVKNNHISIDLDVKSLSEPFIKEWQATESSIQYFNEIIKQGQSFGAYINKKLVGFVICNDISWNNSLWIDNIRVARMHQGLGIGKLLIEHVVTFAIQKPFRVVGLETQNTNYPAIQFYQKCGFVIEGVDFSHYPSRESQNGDIAVFMKYFIKG